MSKRDIRNWFILLCVSLVFTCGYVYGRFCVLKEFEYEIAKFSYILSQNYDNLCMNVANLKME
jgi:hypothetical protein